MIIRWHAAFASAFGQGFFVVFDGRQPGPFARPVVLADDPCPNNFSFAAYRGGGQPPDAEVHRARYGLRAVKVFSCLLAEPFCAFFGVFVASLLVDRQTAR